MVAPANLVVMVPSSPFGSGPNCRISLAAAWVLCSFQVLFPCFLLRTLSFCPRIFSSRSPSPLRFPVSRLHLCVLLITPLFLPSFRRLCVLKPWNRVSDRTPPLHSGVGAMELVAMHLKQTGSFLCRTLSFSGCNFEVGLRHAPEASTHDAVQSPPSLS